MQGRQIGQLRILRELGAGGMGLVFVAEDSQLGRKVALKLLRPRGGRSREEQFPPRVVERFKREIRETAHLNEPGHPAVVQVFQVGELGGLPYYAMELIKGKPLHKLIGPEGMVPAVACRIIRQLAEAVEYAHTHPQGGVLHRDIKPENVLVDEVGNPHLLDFGLAMSLETPEEALTADDTVVGTPYYMPPEQARPGHQAIGPPADVYALGATLLHAVSGQRPYEGLSPAEAVYQVSSGDIPRLRALRPDLPSRLDKICAKAMAADPGRRYASAAALARDLFRFERSWRLEAEMGPPIWIDRLMQWARRNRIKAGVVGAALLVAAVAGLVLDRRMGAVQARYEAHLHQLETRTLARLDRVPGDPLAAVDLQRLVRHQPDQPRLAERLERTLALRRRQRGERATASLQAADRQIRTGELWLADRSIQLAEVLDADRTAVGAARERLERKGAAPRPGPGQARYKGWIYTTEALKKMGLVGGKGDAAWGTLTDHLLEGDTVPGLIRYGSGLFTADMLARARIVQHQGGWRPVESLLAKGLVLFEDRWQPRAALESKLVRRAGKRLTPDELAAQGLLPWKGGWLSWLELVRKGQARLDGDETAPKARKPFRLTADPRVGARVRWK